MKRVVVLAALILGFAHTSFAADETPAAAKDKATVSVDADGITITSPNALTEEEILKVAAQDEDACRTDRHHRDDDDDDYDNDDDDDDYGHSHYRSHCGYRYAYVYVCGYYGCGYQYQYRYSCN